MSKTSPTQRTLAYLRKRGLKDCAIVERYNQWAKVRQDLFGFIDLLCIPIETTGVIGVQACAGASHAARREKILNEPRALRFVERGNTVILISWQKRGARGKVKKWLPRVERITTDSFKKPQGENDEPA